MQERLQKLIARAGVCSRRHAEEMILAGRVAVNGQVVLELGAKADGARDAIRVDGRRLAAPAAARTLLYYKPKNMVTTMADPEGRRSVGTVIEGVGERLYPVGRLDYPSEGLLLLTNDGALADRVLRAGAALPKTYWVKVAGRPQGDALERLRRGIMLEGRRSAPAQIRWLPTGGRARRAAGVYRPSEDNPWLEVVLIEGRHHQIRNMFAAIGHPVEKLKRVGIGRLRIGQLKPGQMRPLTPAEVQELQRIGAGPGARGLTRGAERRPRRHANGARPEPRRRERRPMAAGGRRRLRERGDSRPPEARRRG